MAVCGPGGLGKTALAQQALRALPPDRFPDGVFFHSFYQDGRVVLALEKLLLSFGAEAKPPVAFNAQSLLEHKRALLVLDGCEDADDLKQIIDCAGSECGILITTRNEHQARAVKHNLSRLSEQAAINLLCAWAPEQTEDAQAVADICRYIDYLPLAVCLVGRYLAESRETDVEYLAWLRETPLEALDRPNAKGREDSVPRLLRRSLQQVDEDARQVLALVGQLAQAPFPEDLIRAVLDFSVSQRKHAFRQLSAFGLLERRGEAYAVAHALIYVYAQTQSDDDLFQPLLRYYGKLLDEHLSKQAAGFAILQLHRLHLLHLQAKAAVHQKWQLVIALADITRNFYHFQGLYLEYRLLQEAALVAAQKQQDQQAEANCIHALGDVHRMLAEYEQARTRYEQALPVYREIGSKLGEANCMKALGDVHIAMAEYEQARTRYEQALPVYREIGSKLGEANCMKALGDVLMEQGRYRLAREQYEMVLAVRRQIGDRYGEALVLRSLGAIYMIHGKRKSAQSSFQASVALLQAINHPEVVVSAMQLRLTENRLIFWLLWLIGGLLRVLTKPFKKQFNRFASWGHRVTVADEIEARQAKQAERE